MSPSRRHLVVMAAGNRPCDPRVGRGMKGACRGWTVSWLGTEAAWNNARLVPPSGIPMDTLAFSGLGQGAVATR